MSPSQQEKQGDMDPDPLTKPLLSYGRPKRRCSPLFTWWSKGKASSTGKNLDDIDDEIRVVTRSKEFKYQELDRATARTFDEGPSGDVLEYMASGTLHDHLFADMGGGTIPWQARYKVALSLASALSSLHHDLEEYCVLHRNINSHTVLLDAEFNMKLDAFGFTGQTDAVVSSVTTAAAGAQSYMAPEFCEVGEYTAASDVYSFGVVALELASGRNSSQYASTLGCRYLMQWVRRSYECGILLEAADEKLMGNFDGREMEQLMVVGLWCTHRDPAQRPPMARVHRILQFQEDSPFPVPPDCRVLPPDCCAPDHHRNLSPTTLPGFSHSPSVSSACDSDLDDCLR